MFQKNLITLSVHKQLVVCLSPKFYYLSRDGLSCDCNRSTDYHEIEKLLKDIETPEGHR